MTKVTDLLMRVSSAFGENAQRALDFITDEDNRDAAYRLILRDEDLEKEENERLTKRINEALGNPAPLVDGVYFITEDGNHVLYERPGQEAPANTKRIGIKMGCRTIAIALRNIPGGEDGKLKLLPNTDRCPETSQHYSYDKEADEIRFNVFEDFDGMFNTDRLKKYGCTISLAEDEWIPSMGELGIMMMHRRELNEAIEKAGGEQIKGYLWSSTEGSQFGAWYVYFSDGNTNGSSKYSSSAVRAVAAF